MQHLVIIGNGIAGITAARLVRKLSDRRITVISDESDHFYSRTALMYIYMGQLTYEQTKPYEDRFWEKNRIELLRERVIAIDADASHLHLASGNTLAYDQLLIATGARPNRFGWKGEELDGVQGLYGLQDLEMMERNTRGISRGVVVGGGLIGVEVAEMLHARHIPVTMLVRERRYWGNVLPKEEGEMIARHLRSHGIDLRLETELREILPDPTGRARAVATSTGEEIAAEFVALTAGVSPNIEVTRGSGIETNRGILVDRSLHTNVANVFAAGDCAELREPRPGEPAVEQLWYTGRMQGEAVAYAICGMPRPYERGIWFNSAKFFDIEYQTYGNVPAHLPETHDSLYWEHPDGDRSIRITYWRDTRAVSGFNLFGIRYRQEVCQRWIAEGWTIDRVIPRLKEANFDPEFYRRYEGEMMEIYRRSMVRSAEVAA